MNAHFRANALLLGLTVLLCCVMYPLTVLTFGQVLFPARAAGSLVPGPDGRPIGSALIGQAFAADRYFHPRPSAASYDASASSGSNWSASNPQLRQRAVEVLQQRANAETTADAVTASGSGLDPHITLRNALAQLDRVATAWAARTSQDVESVRRQVRTVIDQFAFTPLGGAAGEPIVNVLEVNLALAARNSDRAAGSTPCQVIWERQ